MTNSIKGIEDADCILVIGSNTTSSHPLVAHRIYRAKAKGARLIVVDPRKTQIALFADIYVPIRPGDDNAFVNGVMNVIVENDWHDKTFIEERTEGFEEFRENLKKYTPEHVEEITGIHQETIRRVAELYAKAERSSIIYCMGITQHTVGT
ncbi:MAG: formate dehydrogenase subunit alpha, partial [Deltaproteobacteria bacterium]